MHQINILGKKTVLKLFSKKDINFKYKKWLNNKKLLKYSNNRFKKFTYHSLKKYLLSFDNKNNFFFKILSLNNIFIGTITCYINRNHKTANIGMMIEDEAGMEAAGSMSPDDRLTQVDVDYAESAARRKPLPALQEYKRKPMTPKERRAQDIAKRAQKKMGGGMIDPTMSNYQKGGSVMSRGNKIARVRPTKLY